MIDFEKMKTEEITYALIPKWHYGSLESAFYVLGEEGWRFLDDEEVTEEIRSKFSEEDLQCGKILVSHFDADAIRVAAPYVYYDLDIQAAEEERDYQWMKEEWDNHCGKLGDPYDGWDSWYERILEEDTCDDEIHTEKEAYDDEFAVEVRIDDFIETEDAGEENMEDNAEPESESVDYDEDRDYDWESYYDGFYRSYREGLTEEEILAYDEKRGGKRFLCFQGADYFSDECESREVRDLILKNREVLQAWFDNEKTKKEIYVRGDDTEGSLNKVARHGNSVLCSYVITNPEIYLMKDETKEYGFFISRVGLEIVDYMREFDARDKDAPVRKYRTCPPEEIMKREEQRKEEWKKWNGIVDNMIDDLRKKNEQERES